MARLKGLLYRQGINGCGVKIFGLHTPLHKRFQNACAVHDCGYDLGGDGQRRAYVDRVFMRDLVGLCRHDGHVLVAMVYYLSVRLLGWLFFNYNDRKEGADVNKKHS